MHVRGPYIVRVNRLKMLASHNLTLIDNVRRKITANIFQVTIGFGNDF